MEQHGSAALLQRRPQLAIVREDYGDASATLYQRSGEAKECAARSVQVRSTMDKDNMHIVIQPRELWTLMPNMLGLSASWTIAEKAGDVAAIQFANA